MRSWLPVAWLFTACAAAALAESETAASDSVLWSDGRTWSGTVRLSGDGRLPLHDGKVVRPVPMDEIACIQWSVETQCMERAWAFVEAGRTEKRFEGEPYPVRHWTTRVTLTNGQVLTGQLISTVFYLESDEGASRLVVRSKQRGKPGETFEDLAGPVELRCARADVAGGSVGTVTHVRVVHAPEGVALGVATLDPTLAATVRLKGAADFDVGVAGRRPVCLLRSGNRLRIGWTDEADPELRERLTAALPHVRDFFDARRVLGVCRDPADPERCHSLMLLWREGHTTLGGERPNPWHVEVWTWRMGEDGQLLFEARAVLVRDRRANRDPLPDVALDPALAQGTWGADAELVWSAIEGGTP